MSNSEGLENPAARKKMERNSRACCCDTNSPLYLKLWPLTFFFSAITDYPMPLPKGKKPGQHRDWGWVPIFLVTGLVTFIYYGYLDRIVLVLLQNLRKRAQGIVYIALFNVFIVLFFVSYARIVLKTPGYAKALVEIEQNTATSFDQRIPHSVLGYPVWCATCQLWKPDRAHHCRVCDACVLKMDHHCPWVNGCIGVANHRFFIQFLFYTSLLSLWTFITSLVAFVQYHGLSTFDGLALAILIISGVFTFVMGSFTFSHLGFVIMNRTTIENNRFQRWSRNKKKGKIDNNPIQGFTESGKNVFNQGWKGNWKEVMGSSPLSWFTPISSQQDCLRDGIHYGVNEDALKEYQNEDPSRRNVAYAALNRT
ncbi:DHHC palmitoyltransferase-domain-containing protein [Sporodiniella umbellata]|nr:DHHC palmitoyltransferase-domain-containing protein [Sporodiniella umbellata]